MSGETTERAPHDLILPETEWEFEQIMNRLAMLKGESGRTCEKWDEASWPVQIEMEEGGMAMSRELDDVPVPTEQCRERTDMRSACAESHNLPETKNGSTESMEWHLSLSETNWIASLAAAEDAASKLYPEAENVKQLEESAVNPGRRDSQRIPRTGRTVQKYRRAKRLLGGQIQQGGQLGRLLAKEKSKTHKLTQTLHLFETRVTKHLLVLKQRFQDARCEIQRLANALNSSEMEKMSILSEMRHLKKEIQTQQMPDTSGESELDVSRQVDMMKNGCEVLEEVIAFINRTQRPSLKEQQDRGIPPDGCCGYHPQLSDIAIQTDQPGCLDPSLNFSPLPHQELVDRGIQCDLMAPLQRGAACRSLSCHDAATQMELFDQDEQKEMELQLEQSKNRCRVLEDMVAELERDLEQERNEVIQLCAQNLHLRSQLPPLPCLPGTHSRGIQTEPLDESQEDRMGDRWELPSSVGSTVSEGCL